MLYRKNTKPIKTVSSCTRRENRFVVLDLMAIFIVMLLADKHMINFAAQQSYFCSSRPKKALAVLHDWLGIHLYLV